MAFAYTAGAAEDIKHWFALFESFVKGIGWTVEAGSGTTDVIIRSVGEGGGYTKLEAHVSEFKGAIWFRVVDDPPDRYASISPGGADFDYWINGDADFVNVCVRLFGDQGQEWDYAGFGCLADFSAALQDETGKMAVAGRRGKDIQLDWFNEAWDKNVVRLDDPAAVALEAGTLDFEPLSVERDAAEVGRLPHVARQYLTINPDEFVVMRFSEAPLRVWVLRTV